MKTKIQSLFLLKAICALFVVIIHFPLAGKIYLDPLIKTSVPIFYMITGYFMFSNLEEGKTQRKLLHASFKILKLILGSSIVYISFNFYIGIPCNLTSINGIIRFIFWGDNISGHLYFLTSYFWATFLLSLLSITQLRQYLPWLSLLIIGNILLGRYFFVLQDLVMDGKTYNMPVGMKNNALFLAIPCISMGYIARQWQNKLSNKQPIILLLIFFMISYMEFIILRKGLHVESLSAFTISTFPLSIFTLLSFVHNNKPLKVNFINRWGVIGEKYSTDIYLWHPIIGTLVMSPLIIFKPILALIIYLLCIIFSYIITLIKSHYIKKNNASISK